MSTFAVKLKHTFDSLRYFLDTQVIKFIVKAKTIPKPSNRQSKVLVVGGTVASADIPRTTP